MSELRAVIVEDEPLGREIVRDLLARDRHIKTVGEASNGSEGLALIKRLRPDLAFVDVEMPEMNGVEVIQALPAAERPAVVFITAYSEFAADAFEIDAHDYVVKPFSDERFFAALERVKARIQEHRLSGLLKRAASEANGLDTRSIEEPSSEFLQTIPVRHGGRSLLIRVSSLLWIESADYYSRLHTSSGSHLVRLSLAKLEKRLDPERFVRIHRGAIVRVDQVVTIEHLPKGAQIVVLSDGTRCRVSRARKSAVDAVLLPTLS